MKAWYGTEAAPALWNKHINDTLTNDCGYKNHPLVQCLYYRKLPTGPFAFIMLHVDDLGGMFPPDKVERNRVKNLLEHKYEALQIQDGKAVTYIGLEVNRESNCFHVSMKTRIQKICEKFGVASDEIERFPCRSGFASKEVDVSKKVNSTEFRSLVMGLRYISSMVIPGILFHTTYLATKQSAPTQQDWEDALWLLRYVNGIRDQKVVITACGKNPILEVYCDASHNLYADGKGHFGIVVFIGNCKAAVYNKSTKIKCGTGSSTDSEIMGMSTGTLIGDFFRLFMMAFDQDCKVVYFQDNDSSTELMTNGTQDHAGKKSFMVLHINMIYEYLADIYNNACIRRMSTTNMIADIHTKNLRNPAYDGHNMKLTGNY